MALEAGADPEALAFFAERMEDDLDTPAAVALHIRSRQATRTRAPTKATQRPDAGSRLTAAVAVRRTRARAAGGDDEEPDEETRALAAQRDDASGCGRLRAADTLRDEIRERGWDVKDGPDGAEWHRD